MPDGFFKAQLRRLMPKAVRPHRILSGPLRGFRIVTSWHDYPAAILGRTERPLLDWFEAHVKPGETWLDVGAHYGYTAIALSRLVGREGRVFAFEPMLATAGQLARTRAINGLEQLTTVPFGLGAPDSFTMMRLQTVRGMVDRTVGTNGTDAEPFVVARLDHIWPSICGGNPRIDGVKVDVQGMEVEVLRGMTTLLKQHQPHLVVEVHAGVDRRDLAAVLAHAGYAPEGVNVDTQSMDGAPLADDRSYHFSPRR